MANACEHRISVRENSCSDRTLVRAQVVPRALNVGDRTARERVMAPHEGRSRRRHPFTMPLALPVDDIVGTALGRQSCNRGSWKGALLE